METEPDVYIARLLYDYDCVIVPQLGGFVTNYRPASFDEAKGVAYPPGKDIGFNRNLTKSDGLLTRTLAEAEGISFKTADEAIHRKVEDYLSRLNEGKPVKFNKIGVLYFDEFKKLRFKPSGEVNFLKSSLGFETFALPATISSETQKTLSAATSTNEDAEIFEISSPGRPTHSRSIYWVAAATLLPFAAMSLYLGLVTDFKSPSTITLAELFPSGNTDASVTSRYEARTAKIEAPEDMSEEGETGFPENTALFPFSFEKNRVDSGGIWVNLSKTTKSNPEVDTEKPITGGLYHVITGCFAEQENALTLVSELQSQGYTAGILDYHNNLYRVKLESFDDFSKAVGTVRNLRNNGTFPNAWLLKKQM